MPVSSEIMDGNVLPLNEVIELCAFTPSNPYHSLISYLILITSSVPMFLLEEHIIQFIIISTHKGCKDLELKGAKIDGHHYS